jgi:hypothetical protein
MSVATPAAAGVVVSSKSPSRHQEPSGSRDVCPGPSDDRSHPLYDALGLPGTDLCVLRTTAPGFIFDGILPIDQTL